MTQDKFGNEIHVGSFIAFATRIGNSAYLKVGIVTKIKDESTMQVLSASKCRWIDNGAWTVNDRLGQIGTCEVIVVPSLHRAIYHQILDRFASIQAKSLK